MYVDFNDRKFVSSDDVVTEKWALLIAGLAYYFMTVTYPPLRPLHAVDLSAAGRRNYPRAGSQEVPHTPPQARRLSLVAPLIENNLQNIEANGGVR